MYSRIEKIIGLAEKNRVGWETGTTGIFKPNSGIWAASVQYKHTI
jgi:hypothetical protein